MIVINLTLIVQLGNFLIVYYFLSKILLDFGIKFLKQKQEELTNMHAVFVKTQLLLSEKKKEQHNKWLDYQLYLQRASPLQEVTIFSLPVIPLKISALSEKTKHYLIQETVTLLIKKVTV